MSVFDNLKAAQAATATASGKTIFVTDSASGKIKNLKLFGESTQAATPTPDNPQPIESKVVNRLIVSAKNLLPIDSFSGAGQVFGDSTPYPLQLNGNFTFSANKSGSGAVSISIYNADMETIANQQIITIENGNIVKKFKEISGGRYIGIYSNSNDNVLTNMQLEAGTTATAYEPYTESKASLSAPIELNGIGNVKDRIVNQNGVWGVDRKISDVDMGTLTYTYDSNILRFVNTSLASSIKKVSDESIANNILSESYVKASFSELYSSVNLDGIIAVSSGGNISIRNKAYTDIAEFKTAMAGVKLLYEIETPTFEPLPIADQIALEKLFMNDPNTTITNDASAEMEIEYFKNNTIGQEMSDIHSSIPQFVLDGVDLHIIV